MQQERSLIVLVVASSLLDRLIAVVVAVLLVLSIVLTFRAVTVQQQTRTEDQDAMGHGAAVLIAQLAAAPIEFNDSDSLEKYVRATLALSPEIHYVAIVDDRGHPLPLLPKDREPVAQEQTPRSDRHGSPQ